MMEVGGMFWEGHIVITYCISSSSTSWDYTCISAAY